MITPELDQHERRRLLATLHAGAAQANPSWTVAHALLALDQAERQTALLAEIRDLLAEEDDPDA